MDSKEDQIAPVSQGEIQMVAVKEDLLQRESLVDKVLKCLNEKRDAYNGIITSIIYIIDSQDEQLNIILRNSLTNYLTSPNMPYGGKIFLSKGLDRLLRERPLFVEGLFEHIIEISSEWSKSIERKSEVLSRKILAIKAIRQAEQSAKGRPTLLPQAVIDQVTLQAIHCCDDATKIDTLSLILESRSTTKPYEDRELTVFKVIYQDALSVQEPALRQILLSLTNKLLKRIEGSNRAVMRDEKKYSDEQRSSINGRYMQFLTWLIEFCFDSLYCNAYFGNYILTLSTLKLVIHHISFCDKSLPIERLFSSKRCYDSILTCLTDSFEENKTLALELLISLPHNDKVISEDSVRCFEEVAYQMAASVNPAHSLTSQYIFKLIVRLSVKHRKTELTKNQLLLQHIGNLVKVVEEGVEDTRQDFVSALKNKPIYPKLTCIRALLEDIDIKDLERNRVEWKTLSKRIVTSFISACEVVSAIVCNLNPETIGHLPMDLKSVDVDTLVKTLNVSLKISDSKLNTITSQMLLICGWKTIKECSLSFGSICNHLWWPDGSRKVKKDDQEIELEPILDSEDIVEIIQFFNHYLRNLRHRGAFEQAYNGFLMVTRQVWKGRKFRDLLISTLHDIMSDFKSGSTDEKKVDCLKAYVTRRSAGLPFIVQAILNSEDKKESETLDWVMSCLFEVLESEHSEMYQRIHCLNILKALIKEHCLGEKVLPYVGKTFAITMESFKSDSFPIRNCASMLLKAAVDRTFGVNRLRDDIHRRNQLSFERFFSQCPDLHDKMIAHLKYGLRDKRGLATVHSVFIVLFRLTPTLNLDASKIIKPFIEPTLELVYNCSDFRLRELASKLVVRLELFSSSDEMEVKRRLEKNFRDHLDKSFDPYDRDCTDSDYIKGLNFNKVHGELMLAKHWILASNDTVKLAIPPHVLVFMHRVAQKIIRQEDEIPCSLKVAAYDVLEAICIMKPNMELLLTPKDSTFSQESQVPHSDSFVFRHRIFTFVHYLKLAYQDITQNPYNFFHDQPYTDLRFALDEIFKLVERDERDIFAGDQYVHTFRGRERKMISISISSDLQASFLRFLRQLFFPNRRNCFIEKLMDKLDIDLTAAHLTPFDKLRQRIENDAEQERLLSFCNQLWKWADPLFQQPFFERYIFRDLNSMRESLSELRGEYSARKCNTPRMVEYFAFVYEFQRARIPYDYESKPIEELEFFCNFISSLPDCDVKCLAILRAGEFYSELAYESYKSGVRIINLKTKEIGEPIIKLLERFSTVLDELADGDHSLKIRETCSEVLRSIVEHTYRGFGDDRRQIPCRLRASFINLFSALIKLGQDEELQVRRASQRVMLCIRDEVTPLGEQGIDTLKGSDRSGLFHTIKMTTKLFDRGDITDHEFNACLNLLTRLIFNNAKSFSNEVNEEQERLFDKTKLNTFADHVTLVDWSIETVMDFFKRGTRGPPKLNDLVLSQEVLQELCVVDSSNDNKTGDYSWRLKKVISNCPAQSEIQRVDNTEIVHRFMDKVLKSLDYFFGGYLTMLTDTDYTHHELSLYKRIAFIKVIYFSTDNELSKSLFEEMKMKIHKLVESSCSTTLLCRCYDLIKDN